MATEDYFSSAVRHFEDSSSLHAMGRLDDAAYLAGYVIECGLKELLDVHRGTGARAYGHDLRGMTTQALLLATLLNPASTRYRVDEIPDLHRALNFWKPELRYWSTGDVTAANAQMMLDTAMGIMHSLIVPLLLDGAERALR